MRARHAGLPGRDVRCMLEREPDIVETFDEARAIGARDLEGEIGTAQAADALGGQIARIGEQELRPIGVHVAIDRGDLIGVDVVLQERDRDAGERGEGLHQTPPTTICRTSTMRPAMAAAAAVAGLARWVRTPLPW